MSARKATAGASLYPGGPAAWMPGLRTFRGDYTTAFTPVALAVWKRGRWCTVAKITTLDGEPVLAIAVRHQRGTETIISVPLPVLDFAEGQGCRWLYYRRDRPPLEMRRIRLAEVRATGWPQADGEVYVPLNRMEPVAWRRWPYAGETLHLAPPGQPVQPTLWSWAGVQP